MTNHSFINNEHIEEERRSMTSRIDRLRWNASDELVMETKERYDKICSLTPIEKLKWEVWEYFPGPKNKVLRDFFVKHPVCWTDLQRKIHAIKKYDNREKYWFIEESKIWEIYSCFLIRERQNDIWEKLRSILRSSIIENQRFLKFCDSQPSILDEWWYMFSKTSIKNRKWNIKKLISTWVFQNIDNCNDFESIKNLVPILLPKILKYIKDIYWKTIRIPIDHSKTFDGIVNAVEKMINSNHGWERENGFRIIQAFFAWSSIDDIEKYHNLALEKIGDMPKQFKKIGIDVIWSIAIESHNDATIYSSSILFQWKTYRAEWRVKTVKSILQKMCETEEYTTKDAIRDMIGISIIYPNNTPFEEKKNVIIATGKLMPNFGYLLKDKWWLWDKIYEVESALQKQWKNPVHVSFKLEDTSNPEISNSSTSGYMSIWWVSIWTEFQHMEESAAQWKKEDDKKYKPKGMITVLMRGPKFSTPKDCYDLLNERIKPGRLKKLWFIDINAMIIHYIEEEKFLIPYISENGKELLFTCKGKEKAFKERFPKVEKCLPWHTYYENARKYIEGIL